MNSALAREGVSKVKVRYCEGEVLILDKEFCFKDETRKTNPKSSKVKASKIDLSSPKKRGRDSSSEEKSKVRKEKKSKTARLFDSDSSDEENLKLLKAAPLPKSPSHGSLAQQVTKLRFSKICSILIICC